MTRDRKAGEAAMTQERTRTLLSAIAVLVNLFVALSWGYYVVGMLITYGFRLEDGSVIGDLMLFSAPVGATLAIVALLQARRA